MLFISEKKTNFLDRALIFVSLLVYFLKKDFFSVSPFKKCDLNIALRFLMEVKILKIPLVIQGLPNSLFFLLDKSFRGACLSMVQRITLVKR